MAARLPMAEKEAMVGSEGRRVRDEKKEDGEGEKWSGIGYGRNGGQIQDLMHAARIAGLESWTFGRDVETRKEHVGCTCIRPF